MSNGILRLGEAGVWGFDWRHSGKNAILGKLWADAQTATEGILAKVVYHSLAQQAVALLEPLEERAAAELERLEGERAALLAEWEAGKSELQTLQKDYHKAGGAGTRWEITPQIGDLSAALGEKAARLVEYDDGIQTASERVNGIARALAGLRAVELPALPDCLRDWLGIGGQESAEPEEPKRRGLRRQ